MSISIQLPPELEDKLRASAAEAGMDINQYVLEILQGQLRSNASKATNKAERESELLEKVNLGMKYETIIKEILQENADFYKGATNPLDLQVIADKEGRHYQLLMLGWH